MGFESLFAGKRDPGWDWSMESKRNIGDGSLEAPEWVRSPGQQKSLGF